MSISNALTASMEAVSFQTNQKLFTELGVLIGVIRAQKPEGVDLQKYLTPMEKLIFEHTGISVRFTLLEWEDALYVSIPPMFQAHPFNTPQMNLRLERAQLIDLTLKGIFKGEVDLQNSRVSGDFSNVVFDIFIGDCLFYGDLLTDEEHAADMLHELGHCFTYLELLGDLYRTNAVMQEVTKVFTGNTDTKIRIDSLTMVEKLYGTTFEDKKALALNPDPMAVQAVVAGMNIKRLRSITGTRFYDERLAEAMADQFATRHGAGRHLVTAVDKLGRERSLDKAYDQPLNPFLRFGLAAGTLYFVPMAAATGLFGAYVLTSVLCKMFVPKSRDNPMVRYTAIRNDVVNALKNRNLPGSMKRQLMMDIEVIDNEIKDLNPRIGLVDYATTYLADVFSGHAREVRFQRELEDLANNSLFIKAAQLDAL